MHIVKLDVALFYIVSLISDRKPAISFITSAADKQFILCIYSVKMSVSRTNEACIHVVVPNAGRYLIRLIRLLSNCLLD